MYSEFGRKRWGCPGICTVGWTDSLYASSVYVSLWVWQLSMSADCSFSVTWASLRDASRLQSGNHTFIYKGKAVPRHIYGGAGWRTQFSSYSMISALDRVSGQRHAPAAIYPRGRASGTHWTGVWVGPRAGLDKEARGKIFFIPPGIEPRSSSL
jgi:hypothetical protein